MTPDQQAFEDRCWEHYLAERARRTMHGDVEGEPTREGLFWRRDDGLYGVLAFNTAWMAYQWGRASVQAVPDGQTQALQTIADWNAHSLELAVDRGSNGVRDFYRQIAIDALASAPPAPQAIAPELDVRKIMLAIEPGPGGYGEEVYAKSVNDVLDMLTKMGQELEEWQLGIKRLPAQQAEKRLTGLVLPTHFDALTGAGIPDPTTFGGQPQASVVQQEPYLDNASECHTVYTYPAQRAERKPLFADLIAQHDGLSDELKAIDSAVDAQHGGTHGR